MQYERLFKLRKSFGLSQDEMANIFNVSRQAVQKWENGTSVPDVDHLMELARYFNVTVDYLLFNEETRSIDELRIATDLHPTYQAIQDGELYSSTLMTEYRQCVDEGKEILSYENLFREISKLAPGKEKEALADVLFTMIRQAPQIPGYPYHEPSDYASIQKLVHQAKKISADPISKDAYRDKIKGAWVGRICGCLLGKVIEGISCEELNKLLRMSNNFPMHRYILRSDMTEEVLKAISFRPNNSWFADVVDGAPVDDDTNYTVMAMQVIERYGRSFTPKKVADMWIDCQSKNAYFTAERVAYRNLIAGFCPPSSAGYKNPYREWIGAQIRADYFGYINPCDPKAAAEMAWRDAVVSHEKNGIYGEMMIATMLAAAAGSHDIKEVIKSGLGEIPVTSRLYKRIESLVDSFESGITSKEFFRDFHNRYHDRDPYDWCHTISNAEIVVASLLYGESDYAKSVCMAVENGFDTDCNGATVGSILGMMNGIQGIPSCWTEPIKNTLHTSLFGFPQVSVDDLVGITCKHCENIKK